MSESFVIGSLERPRLTDQDIERLKALGYQRVSRKYGIIARIDRPDWRRIMVKMGAGNCINSPDHYRRCYSRDKMKIHPEDALKFDVSDNREYTPIDPNEGTICSLCSNPTSSRRKLAKIEELCRNAVNPQIPGVVFGQGLADDILKVIQE